MSDPNVLVVEDKESDVRLVQEAFRQSGISVNLSAVYDGEQAVDYIFKRGRYASAATPDVVILDIKMPKKNGREVLKELRENPATREVPVVMLTNSDAREDILDSYGHKANAYITKPLELREFIDIINHINETWLSGPGR